MCADVLAPVCTCCRYGRTSASDEEVEEAARVAHIHAAVVRRFPGSPATQHPK